MEPEAAADLVVLVPMLGRPHRVGPLLDSIRNTTVDATVLFCLTPNDDEVAAAVDAHGCPRLNVAWQPLGDYARKINAGYRHSTQPLIFTGADDLCFHPGWLGAVRAALAANPDAGVVGTQDRGNPRVIAGQHSTHSLVTRRYADTFGTIDRPGEILHEGYPHEYVDDELVGTAQARRAFVFARDAVVEHLHACWGKAPMDSLYAAQPQRMRQGRALFLERRTRWT